MAIAKRRIRRKRPMAPPAYGGGAAGGGFGGANMMAPAVMPGAGGGFSMASQMKPGFEGMATGGGYGPGADVLMQPGGPINQFGGFQGGAQQLGPNSGLLGNIMGGGGMGQGMPPGMGQPQQAVMPEGWQGGMAEPQPGMGGGMGQPTIAPQPQMPGGGMGQGDPQPQYDPGVSAGRLAEAQRLAGLGQMGRAKQQWELGGGSWGGDAHRFLRG